MLKDFQQPIDSRLKLTALFAIVFICGCGTPDEFSETMTEAGEVYDTAFVPAGHGNDTAVGFNTGKGGGVTITPIDVNIPERYAVVFKCLHGKFVVDGDKAKGLYQKLDRGDKVTISYREVIRVVDGKRSIVDLDFLDAVKMQSDESE